jgi:hypothetical protein
LSKVVNYLSRVPILYATVPKSQLADAATKLLNTWYIRSRLPVMFIKNASTNLSNFSKPVYLVVSVFWPASTELVH